MCICNVYIYCILYKVFFVLYIICMWLYVYMYMHDMYVYQAHLILIIHMPMNRMLTYQHLPTYFTIFSLYNMQLCVVFLLLCHAQLRMTTNSHPNRPNHHFFSMVTFAWASFTRGFASGWIAISMPKLHRFVSTE